MTYHLAAANARMGFFDRVGVALDQARRLRDLDQSLPSGVVESTHGVLRPYRQHFVLAFASRVPRRAISPSS